MSIEESLGQLLPLELQKLGLWHGKVWVMRLQGHKTAYLYLAPSPLNLMALSETSPGEEYPVAEAQLGTQVLNLSGKTVKKIVFHPETSVVSFHFSDRETLHLHCAGAHATMTDQCGAVITSSSRHLQGGSQYTPPPDRTEAYVWKERSPLEIGGLSAEWELKTLKEKAERLLNQNLQKARKKLERICEDLANSDKEDYYRRCGELLKINYHLLGPRMEKVAVPDVFGNGEEVEIKLLSPKSPAENVTHYFELADKALRGRDMLKKRETDAEREIAGLEGQLAKIGDMQAEELKSLLEESAKKPQPPPKPKAIQKKNDGPKAKVYRCVSSDGFHIIAGRTAEDNDYVTMRLASGNDGWLHVRDYPGSHAIIRAEKKRPISNTAWKEAAELCAALSKAPDNNLVDVIYTYKKFVSKPRHAKAGLVMVAGGKNITVRKDTRKNKEWLQSHFADNELEN